ncbi:MAG: metallophosphoesterase family protein [Terrimonas sp.]|uniref:metallophosphoesterase family protein n=1 Tax=uncultured Dysgonomonas sp. TaxID=206096 RepID=UPI001ACBAE18|nr:metallophosphoesterase family protein [uncultured Dysgonomonas sp.]MBN8787401.1 metallophosphoesterase family protein [Terrimonas sp.]MBN8857101.1 metallophosphoesterase family protein [Sphingobacteriales bacterium]
MTIILFSDIHANLPAFQKMLEALANERIDAIFCLGDLVGYNVWPNEIINEIRNRRIPTIAGNHDVKAHHLTPEELSTPGVNYAYQLISQENMCFLKTLPAHMSIEFQLTNQSLKLLLVHGSPASNKEYLLEEKPEGEFIEVFDTAGVDILCFGHSHKPYHRILKAEKDRRTRYYHAINTGSVGKPKDNNPRGGYVRLAINEHSSIWDEKSLQVEFIRFDYDIEKAAKAIEDSPLPIEFADRLRKGV